MHAQLSAETDPTAEAYGRTSTLITGRGPLPFRPPRNLPARVQREVSLDLKRGHLISLLQQSLVSATNFALGIPEWEQRLNFTPLDRNPRSSPGACSSPTSGLSHMHRVGRAGSVQETLPTEGCTRGPCAHPARPTSHPSSWPVALTAAGSPGHHHVENLGRRRMWLGRKDFLAFVSCGGCCSALGGRGIVDFSFSGLQSWWHQWWSLTNAPSSGTGVSVWSQKEPWVPSLWPGRWFLPPSLGVGSSVSGEMAPGR